MIHRLGKRLVRVGSISLRHGAIRLLAVTADRKGRHVLERRGALARIFLFADDAVPAVVIDAAREATALANLVGIVHALVIKDGLVGAAAPIVIVFDDVLMRRRAAPRAA